MCQLCEGLTSLPPSLKLMFSSDMLVVFVAACVTKSAAS